LFQGHDFLTAEQQTRSIIKEGMMALKYILAILVAQNQAARQVAEKAARWKWLQRSAIWIKRLQLHQKQAGAH